MRTPSSSTPTCCRPTAGTRTASITGAYVALHDAVERLRERGSLAGEPLTGSVSAISVGIVKGVPMLDLAYDEDSTADVDMNIVATGTGDFVEVQGTAEGATFDRKLLGRLLDLADKGNRELTDLQQRVIAAADGKAQL